MDGTRDGAKLRAAAITVDAVAAATASELLHRTAPSRSAKRVLFWTQALALLVCLWALSLAVRHAPALTWRVALVFAYALFMTATCWRLVAAASLRPLLSRLAEPESDWPTYTLLCPIYREADVVFDLMAAIDRLDYPKAALDVKILVEGDDLDTLAAALAASGASHIEVIIVPTAAAPRTKPKALNVGLARARGEFLAVYDAEDRPHPLQLRAALAAFEDGGEQLACVQAPLVVDNAGASWISQQFAAEYAVQFRETLPTLARLGLPLPLGGSSNHFRTDTLRAAGGWDSYNVTEDIDLAYRLARDGWRSNVIAPPTWEEAPITFEAWRAQRTRWIKGHIHTWLVLMRDPFRSAREMGAPAFWSMQLVLGGGLAASFLHGPLAILVVFALLSPGDTLGAPGFALALGGYCVGVFATLTASALSGDLSHLRAAPTMPFYWALSTLAALGAVFDLVLRPHHWAKTAHGVSPRARPRYAQPLPRTASITTPIAESA